MYQPPLDTAANLHSLHTHPLHSNETEVRSGEGSEIISIPLDGGDERLVVDDGKTPLPFEFDAVLSADATQVCAYACDPRGPLKETLSSSKDHVFNEVKPLVTSCMDGYSVTIFAYVSSLLCRALRSLRTATR
jgi:hypothetical protein